MSLKTRSVRKSAVALRRESSISIRADQAADSRTVDMVFTTTAPVRTGTWEGWDWKEFNEVLSMDPAHIRMDRMKSGKMPLLNNHSRFDLMDQIGVVVGGEPQGEQLVGSCRFSKRSDVEPIYQDVQDRIIQNGSVGYRVYKYQDISEDDDKIPTLLAVDWEPVEFSLVCVPADAASGVKAEHGQRSDQVETHEVEIILKQLSIEGEDMTGKHRLMNKAGEGDAGGAGAPAPVAAPAAAAPQPIDAKAEKAAARKEELQRCRDIRAAVKAAGLEDSVAETLIEGEKTADEARKHVLDALAEKQAKTATSTINARVTSDAGDHAREGAADALLARALPSQFKVTEKGAMYMRYSLFEMCQRFLRMRGMNPDTMMSKDEILRKAFMAGSDLPAIFLDAANKAALRGYGEAPQTFEPFTNRVSISDFKNRNAIKMGDMPALLKVGENGEIKNGSFSDEKESYALATYARKLTVSRQMVYNDDLSFLGQIPAKWGRKARTLEGDLVYACLTANSGTGQTMADTYALFDATNHGNYKASGGAAPSVATVGVGDAALGVMTGLDGEPLNLTSKLIIAPIALKSVVMGLVMQITPTKASDVNPYRGALTPIFDQRLDKVNTAAWYLAASKDDIDMIELATLDGQPPKIEAQEGWDVLGSEMRISYDVAAHAVEWRGFYRNIGS